MKFNPILIVAALALGLCAGLTFGYFLGAFVWTPRVTNVDYFDLKSATQDDVIVLIADAYALDGDIAVARERLAQFKDAKMPSRVVALAKKYSASNEPSASSLAALAIALGNSDADIAQLAVTRTPTLTPTPTRTPLPSATPTFTPTIAGPTPTTVRASATPTRPRTATPTSAPKPAALAPTTWLPGFPAEWPGGTKYEPANVAPGQKYWHLAKAIYCDTNDEHDYCQNMPGGPLDTSTYIMFAGGGAPPISVVGDGKSEKLDPKPAGDSCNCAYSFQSNGFTIQVLGAPSDQISGLALYSVKAKLGNYHVRYFLWFEMLTK